MGSQQKGSSTSGRDILFPPNPFPFRLYCISDYARLLGTLRRIE